MTTLCNKVTSEKERESERREKARKMKKKKDTLIQ